MVVSRELLTKGSAILGSAGAGGTGLYYGGRYVSGLSKGAADINDHVAKSKDNYATFSVQKQSESGTWLDLNDHNNDVKFDKKNPFVVKVTAKSLNNANVANTEGGSQAIDSASALTCSFKFEVEGDIGTTTTIKDNY